MISTLDSLSVSRYGANVARSCSFPTTYPILFKVKAAYFLLAYILSLRPSARVVMNILVKTLRSLSFKTGNRVAVSCMKVLTMFLFESLMWGLSVFIRSFMHEIVTRPKLSFTKAIIA